MMNETEKMDLSLINPLERENDRKVLTSLSKNFKTRSQALAHSADAEPAVRQEIPWSRSQASSRWSP